MRRDLELKWVFQARWLDYYQATPLVVDGIMYTTQGNDVLALDAATGKMFWIYPYTPASDARFCCGRITRGLAILGDTLFLATVDAHLIAIDAKTGRPLWNRIVAPMHGRLFHDTGAAGRSKTRSLSVPRAASSGSAASSPPTMRRPERKRGGSTPCRCQASRDTRPGARDGRHGGASIWVTGSYDPETNLTFWGVGNPGPDYNAETRPGDNLYSYSVVALDADTRQAEVALPVHRRNDEFDWDAVQVPVLADIPWQGQPRKAMLWANRNGFFYVLDRRTGEFLQATPIAKQNWNAGFDKKGRPISDARIGRRDEGVLIYPGNQGATNWFNPSFSPRTGLFYVNVWENSHHIFARTDQPYVEGANLYAGTAQHELSRTGNRRGYARRRQRPNLRKEEENYGTVRAFDPQTGKWKWEYKMSRFDRCRHSDDGIGRSVHRRARGLLLRPRRAGTAHFCGRSSWADRSRMVR